MDPNFDRLRRRFGNSGPGRRFQSLRGRLYRSTNGKVLGVFSGIAESLGYGVCRTRIIGVIALLVIASMLDAHNWKLILVVTGFFYLLAALLMQPPRTAAGAAGDFAEASGRAGDGDDDDPPPIPARRQSWRGAVPPATEPPRGGLRPDFAQIERQLDSLNRRIQRMETIVTDRQYDWESRLGS